jgi:CubicO group peptidase (beta-lactamase class C family)
VAIKDGFIKNVDDPLTLYLPKLKGSAYDGVTIKHLITMTSGVAWNEDYSDPKSDVSSYLLNPPNDGSDRAINYLSNLKRSAEPGTVFNYNSAETDLAGSLIFAATGKYLADYLTEKIWQPYGMETDANWLTVTGGLEQGGCCVSASLRDLGRLGMFIMNGAKIDGVSIVPDNWIEMATTATPVSKEVDFLKSPITLQDGYGYFWWTVGSRAYMALGVFGQLIYINPVMNLIIVTQSAWPTALAYRDSNLHLVEAVEKALER